LCGFGLGLAAGSRQTVRGDQWPTKDNRLPQLASRAGPPIPHSTGEFPTPFAHVIRPRNPIAHPLTAPILPSVQDPLPTGAQPTLRFSEGTLLLEDMPKDALGGLFDGMEARWDARVPAWRTDALNYRPQTHRLRGVCPTVQDLVPQWTKVAFAPSLPAPWPEQAAAIEAWLKTRKGVVVMPTGTGKTEVALHLMARLGESALVVAPIRDLMYQWQRRILTGLGYDAGIPGSEGCGGATRQSRPAKRRQASRVPNLAGPPSRQAAPRGRPSPLRFVGRSEPRQDSRATPYAARRPDSRQGATTARRPAASTGVTGTEKIWPDLFSTNLPRFDSRRR
jgi:hypothetical protein